MTARKYLETTLGRTWGAATTAVGYMARIRELRDSVRGDLTVPTAWWSRRIADAGAYVNEQDLHDWVHVQNETLVAAPTTRAIFGRRSEGQMRTGPTESTRGTTISATLFRRQVQWTRRFMRRWDVRRGTLPVGTCMPMTEAAEKVPGEPPPSFFRTFPRPKNPPVGPFPGPLSPARKWPPIGGHKRKTRLRACPESGRRKGPAETCTGSADF